MKLILKITFVLGLSLILYIYLWQINKQVTCEELAHRSVFITQKTSDALNGTTLSKAMGQFIEYCENNEVIDIIECEKNTIDQNEKLLCYVTLGLNAKSIDVCESNKKCETGFLMKGAKDCHQFKNIESGEGACLYAQAYSTEKREYCDQIEFDLFTKSCDFKYDTPQCYYTKNKCLWALSDKTDNVSLCDELPISMEKNICYIAAALRHSDVTQCEKITYSDTAKNICKDVLNGKAPISNQGIIIDYAKEILTIN